MDSIDPPPGHRWLVPGLPEEHHFSPGMEHRWGRRMPCFAAVRLSAGNGATGQGRLRNVSMSGAYLETSVPLSLFTPVEIAVTRTDGTEAPVLRGCVVRRDAEGVGIEWADIMAGPICPLLGCDLPCSRRHHPEEE